MSTGTCQRVRVALPDQELITDFEMGLLSTVRSLERNSNPPAEFEPKDS